MTPSLSQSLGLVFLALGSLFFLFREFFAMAFAGFLAGISTFFSARECRSSGVVFPAASLPQFPRGIPRLGKPQQHPINPDPQDTEEIQIEDQAVS